MEEKKRKWLVAANKFTTNKVSSAVLYTSLSKLLSFSFPSTIFFSFLKLIVFALSTFRELSNPYLLFSNSGSSLNMATLQSTFSLNFFHSLFSSLMPLSDVPSRIAFCPEKTSQIAQSKDSAS